MNYSHVMWPAEYCTSAAKIHPSAEHLTPYTNIHPPAHLMSIIYGARHLVTATFVQRILMVQISPLFLFLLQK